MKYKPAVFLAVILVLSGLGLQNISSGENIRIMDYNQYCIVNIDEKTSMMYKESYPILPLYVKTVTYPFGTVIKDINIEPKNIERFFLEKKIAPSPPTYPLSMNITKVDFVEGEIYSKDEFYPNEWFNIKTGMGLHNGKHVLILSIQLFPIQYNAVKNEVLYANDFSFSVDYNTPKSPLLTSNNQDLLIISPSQWTNNLETLKQHKQSQGIRTKILTTDEIYSLYFGRDEQEDIKYAIRNSIEQDGITSVLLIGDSDIIPPRNVYAYDGAETNFPSDLYYADVYFSDGSFSSWDSNENDRFGEFRYQGETDNVDMYPDISIGRIPCSTGTELDIVIEKIITYESTTYGSDWFNNIITIGGDTFTSAYGDDSGIYEGEYMNQIVIDTMTSPFNEAKLWASLDTLSTETIRSNINSGAGFVDFSGHGSKTSWATHPPDGGQYEWIGTFTTATASSLTNGNMLPIMIFDACSCGRFDQGTCLAWSTLKNSQGGSVATLAASALGYGIPGSPDEAVLGWMEKQFFISYKSGNTIIGNIWLDSISGYLNNFGYNPFASDIKTVMEWTIFGDPTLMIGGSGNDQPIIFIETPQDGYLYFKDNPLIKTLLGGTKAIGDFTVQTSAYNIESVDFYFDGEFQYTDTEAPFEWTFKERAYGTHTIKVIGHGYENQSEDEITLQIFHL